MHKCRSGGLSPAAPVSHFLFVISQSSFMVSLITCKTAMTTGIHGAQIIGTAPCWMVSEDIHAAMRRPETFRTRSTAGLWSTSPGGRAHIWRRLSCPPSLAQQGFLQHVEHGRGQFRQVMDGTRGHAKRRQEQFQIIVLNAQAHDLEAQSNHLLQGMSGCRYGIRRTVREDENYFPLLLQRTHSLHDPP